MLNLQEVKKAVDHFSAEELRELREYLENRALQLQTRHPLTAEERIRHLRAAAKAIHTGFTAAEWDVVERAINEEYVEPWDESEWNS